MNLYRKVKALAKVLIFSTPSLAEVDTTNIEWTNFDKQPYLEERVISPRNASQYSLTEYHDKEGKKRGFLRLQRKNQAGEVLEIIDFESDGFIADVKLENKVLTVTQGTDVDGIDAVFSRIMKVGSPELPQGIVNNTFLQKDVEGGKELYGRATKEYAVFLMLLELQ